MPRHSFAERHPVTVLAAATLIGLAFILLLMEGAVRLLFPSINFLDTDARLFVQNAYGPTHGNAPNFRGISFGAPVSTDGSGFRTVVAGASGDRPTVLVLGDSVAFGVGVPDGETFADLLAQRFPELHFLNAASIGYDVEDYRSFVDGFILPNRERLHIRQVVLGYCLNDLSPRSREAIANRAQAPAAPASPAAYVSPEPQKYEGLAAWIHARVPFVNDWLRSRSKLFLLVKSLLVDASQGYFLADNALYKDQTALHNLFARLQAMSHALNRAGVGFQVAIFPYEYQMRAPQPELLAPQRKLAEFMRQNGIPFVDLTDAFSADMQRAGGTSKDFYLFNDPMHLSARGHRVTAEALGAVIGAARPGPSY